MSLLADHQTKSEVQIRKIIEAASKIYTVCLEGRACRETDHSFLMRVIHTYEVIESSFQLQFF